MNDDQDLKNITDPLVDETTPPSDPASEPLVDETTPLTEEVIPETVETQNKGQEDKEDKDDSEVVEVKDDQKGQEDSDDDKTEEVTEEVEDQKTDKSESDTEESTDAPKPAPKTEPTGPKAHWYVVHTYSGHEAKVATTLKQRIDSQKIQDKILDILVPTQEKIEIKEGKKSTIKEKIFPGYILIRMVLDDISWLAVRTTPGVTSFVGNANKPTPLSEAEVETIKRFMSMEAPKFKTAFAVGEAVKIIEGPFAEFLGSIAEIDEEKGKLKVMVSIFGRETPVELDFLQVNKL